MRVELSFIIEVPSVAAANNLSGRLRTRLSEETTVYSSSVEEVTRAYDVTGVDTEAKQRFTDRVEADSAESAETQVATATKIVVVVKEGR
jgi:hypothetical protein